MYKEQFVVFYICMIVSKVIVQDSLNAICIMNYTCVPFSKCRDDGSIHYPCNDLQTQVCCPPDLILEDTEFASREHFRALPEQCGIISSSDRITGGQRASPGQFPWMALLGYKQIGLDVPQFLCGGSVITKEYILTAAHCINIHARIKLSIVRLGELDLETEIDCEQGGIEKVCADKYIDIPVDQVFVHDEYDSRSLDNDIAIIKLRFKISKYTDYIQPICLPISNDTRYEATPNNKLVVSGWGKTSSGNVGGSSYLQYAEVKLWSHLQCNASVPITIRPIKESQICANGVRHKDACKGDSGGPLINNTIIRGDIRSYQVGIVSFASAQTCGNAEFPSIYTKVEYYLDWIMSKITQVK